MSDQKNSENLECIICFQSFTLHSDLTDHLRRHIGIKSFTCTTCSESFRNKNQLLEHRETHKEESNGCSEANENYKNPKSNIKSTPESNEIDKFEEAELLQNIDRIIDEKIRYVNVEYVNQITNELPEVDLEVLSQCTLCSKEFPSTVDLAAHLQKHIKLKPFDCTSCLKSFGNKNELLEHVKLCEEVMENNVTVKKVVKKNDENDFKCPNCSLKFYNIHNLKIHFKKYHVGGKPYICSICERQFASNTNLRKHLRYHVGEINYVCSYCKKGFVQRHSLRVHLRKHTGEKPYACDICSKTFSSKSNRDNHVMAHNKQYKYRCDICDKTFIKKINYMVHLKNHYEVKLHSCNICLKSYLTKNSLKQHILGHAKPNNLKCPICSKIFKTKYRLTHHRKLEHEVNE